MRTPWASTKPDSSFRTDPDGRGAADGSGDATGSAGFEVHAALTAMLRIRAGQTDRISRSFREEFT